VFTFEQLSASLQYSCPLFLLLNDNNQQNMFTNLWIKYLPVIRLLVKKSLKEDQVLTMNVPDFERAGIKRKAAVKFSMCLKNGRPSHGAMEIPLAASLVTVLLAEPSMQELLADAEYCFSVNTKYELNIRHIQAVEELAEETTEVTEKA
jgi:hypothetical protein